MRPFSALDAAGALLAIGYLMKRRSASSGAPQAYENGVPIVVDLVAVDDKGHMLSAAAAADFTRMREAAASAGVSLIITESFRSMDRQTELWLQYKSGERSDQAAAPGYSLHQSGRAADLETARGTNAAYEWLVRNAHLFHFKATVAVEPWHWEHRP